MSKPSTLNFLFAHNYVINPNGKLSFPEVRWYYFFQNFPSFNTDTYDLDDNVLRQNSSIPMN